MPLIHDFLHQAGLALPPFSNRLLESLLERLVEWLLGYLFNALRKRLWSVRRRKRGNHSRIIHQGEAVLAHTRHQYQSERPLLVASHRIGQLLTTDLGHLLPVQ